MSSRQSVADRNTYVRCSLSPDVTGSADAQTEVPVRDVLPSFAAAFPFERFNAMQTATLPALLNTDENVVVSAPTASGKTAIAEVAICRTLDAGGTALFLAPLRALTNEKEREWERFEELGYSVYVVTGERDLNPRRAERADVLVMTPEKADSATRKHDSRRYSFMEDIECCIIDEVHLLDSAERGSVLEVTISRLRRLCDPRVVALSATMPNVEDVAAWLDAPDETTFTFGEDYRPVPLAAEVATYARGENAFADKYRRLYRALDLVEPHVREEGQALIFVSSRQDTVQAAKKARDELASRDIPVETRGDYDFHTAAEELDDDTLRQSVLDGVGFHHAGLSRSDRNLVEEWFREGRLKLLFSTSTLAWGVNLPARCVVIRDTTYHDPLEGEVQMSPLDVLQMLGRAGRPGYDDRGYAWVICDGSSADTYRQLLADGKTIESRLADRNGTDRGGNGQTGAEGPAATDLAVHLNAEIALGTVKDVDDAMDWLETTYYYVRAQRASAYASGSALRARVSETLEWLVDAAFVEMDELAVEPTPLGRLASEFYLELTTARSFADLAACEDLSTFDVLVAVATADEFDSVSARSDEQDAIDAVLGERASDHDPGTRKVLAILRAGMGGTTPSELRSDAWVIRQNALRLLAALRAVVDRFGSPTNANLVKRIEARVETGISEDAVGLTAIDGIGSSRASSLAAVGYQSPAEVAEASVSDLVAAGLSEGVAERVHESAGELPAVVVDWGDFPDSITRGERELHEVTVRTAAGDARASLTVTVNGAEMTTKATYLGQTTVPVGVFGGSADELEFTVRAVFPDLPLAPVERSRQVTVHD
jgi:replicative superfamily II helicase